MALSVIYSFNKSGTEAEFWTREIAAASSDQFKFIPFNHGTYLPSMRYIRAQLLDNLYFEQHPALMRMYRDVRQLAEAENAAAIIVDNCFPYHPDWLRTLHLHKVLRTSDGPLTAYDRDFAYVHAYDQVLYHSPAYSPDFTMPDKLRYLGAKRADFWPFAVFNAMFDTSKCERNLFECRRDIDVVFIGFPYMNKLPAFARLKKALGKRLVIHGFSFKHNVYFNAKYRYPGWVGSRLEPGQAYVQLYQRAKIGFNVHNRGEYTIGNYRLFELPANGVMQISDGRKHIGSFFENGTEIVACSDVDEMIDRIRYYLDRDDERLEIARNAYRRVMRDHRIYDRLQEAGTLIEAAMASQ